MSLKIVGWAVTLMMAMICLNIVLYFVLKLYVRAPFLPRDFVLIGFGAFVAWIGYTQFKSFVLDKRTLEERLARQKPRF